VAPSDAASPIHWNMVSQSALWRETDLAAATRRWVPAARTISGSGDDGSTATGGGCTESQQDGENDVFHCNSRSGKVFGAARRASGASRRAESLN
jgi:hypothetical protein